MVHEHEQGSSSGLPQVEPDVVALIKKMQQQLVFLEKKIDILINQTTHRPLGEKNFSRPSRPFGRPHRPYDRERGGASGDKRFDRGRPFEKGHGKEHRGFDRKKKAYGDPRRSGFGQDRDAGRNSDGSKKGFDHRKKSFRFKRKGRG